MKSWTQTTNHVHFIHVGLSVRLSAAKVTSTTGPDNYFESHCLVSNHTALEWVRINVFCNNFVQQISKIEALSKWNLWHGQRITTHGGIPQMSHKNRQPKRIGQMKRSNNNNKSNKWRNNKFRFSKFHRILFQIFFVWG